MKRTVTGGKYETHDEAVTAAARLINAGFKTAVVVNNAVYIKTCRTAEDAQALAKKVKAAGLPVALV